MNGDDPKLVMARRAAASVWTKQGVQDFADRIMAGSDDFCEEVQAALAAILETQRRDAEMVQRMADERRAERDRLPHPNGDIGDEIMTRVAILELAAMTIRTGTHYGKADQ